jgi:hypothetical protein
MSTGFQPELVNYRRGSNAGGTPFVRSRFAEHGRAGGYT